MSRSDDDLRRQVDEILDDFGHAVVNSEYEPRQVLIGPARRRLLKLIESRGRLQEAIEAAYLKGRIGELDVTLNDKIVVPTDGRKLTDGQKRFRARLKTRRQKFVDQSNGILTKDSIDN